jgi:hypothetical protein
MQHGKDDVKTLQRYAALDAIDGYIGRGAFQQSLRRVGRQPVTGLVNANRRHIEFAAIDCLQNGGSREQRDFMLTAAPAKDDSYTEFFCHILIE